MGIQVTDDIFRRALDLLGLRGFVPHEYFPAVIPVVQVAELGQRQISSSVNNTVTFHLAAAFTVPAGESWRPRAMWLQILQTGGTIAPVFKFLVRNSGNLNNRGVPFFLLNSGAAVDGERTQGTIPVNGSGEMTFRFPEGTFLAPGDRIEAVLLAGDGTVQLFGIRTLLYDRFGEVMVQVS
jgi:hypothetical protein